MHDLVVKTEKGGTHDATSIKKYVSVIPFLSSPGIEWLLILNGFETNFHYVFLGSILGSKVLTLKNFSESKHTLANGFQSHSIPGLVVAVVAIHKAA